MWQKVMYFKMLIGLVIDFYDIPTIAELILVLQFLCEKRHKISLSVSVIENLFWDSILKLPKSKFIIHWAQVCDIYESQKCNDKFLSLILYQENIDKKWNGWLKIQ